MRLLSRSRASSWSSYIFLLSKSSRPISVDLPSSTEPAVRKRSKSLRSSLSRNSSIDILLPFWLSMSFIILYAFLFGGMILLVRG